MLSVDCKNVSYLVFQIPGQNKSDRNWTFPEQQHEERIPLSPSYPGGSEKPLPSCLSCEAVPVIRHASACGKLSHMEKSSTPNYDLSVAFDLHGRESENSQSVDLSSYKHKLGDHKFQNIARNDDILNEPASKRVKVASHVLHSDHVLCHQTESPKDFADELLESRNAAVVKTSVTVSPKTVFVSAQIRQAKHKDEDLSPHPETSRDLTLSDASRDSCHGHLHSNKAYEHSDDASNQFRLAENEHNMPHASLEFSNISANIPVDSHSEQGHHNVLCHLQSEDDTQYAVHIAVSRENSSQDIDMQTCRASSDSKSWFDSVRSYAQGPVVSGHSITADTPAVRELARGDHSSTSERSSSDREDDGDLFSPQNYGVHTYQGQVRYHCLRGEPQQVTGSSDSDEDGLYMIPTETAGSKQCSTPGIPLSEASTSEPSVGLFNLSKAHQNLVVQPYQCTMCDRAFSQRGSLNRHMRSHLGVRPYACPQCPMTFSRQYRVTEHMRVHQRGCEDLQRAGPT